MTKSTKVIYHCSTGRLSGWAAALHLGGLSSDISILKPLYDRQLAERQPGRFVMVGNDTWGHEVYAWQHGRSLPIFRRAFASMNEIFGLEPNLLFVDLDLPRLRRLGLIAMMNALTDYGDTEMLRWARPELESIVMSTIRRLKEQS